MPTSVAPVTPDDDQETRIATLRAEIEKLGGSTVALEAMPADMEEEFLRHVLEYEKAEPISLFTLLANKTGAELPAPDTLEDTGLTIILMKTVKDMSDLGAYLIHTNHLSDRELYTYLFNEGLREEAVLFPENPAYAYMIDLTGNGSDEDNTTYLRYYADEAHRQQWAQDWPDDHIPAREDPPFDRDQQRFSLVKTKGKLTPMQTPSPDQQQRIAELRTQLDGNDTAANLPPSIPANLEEELLRLVLTYDHMPTSERREP